MNRVMAGLLLGILASVCPTWAAVQSPNGITGIIGAKDLETAVIRETIQNPQSRSVLGIDFVLGTLGGHSVVVVTAGEGIVNAATATTLLIEHFKPARVIFTGIAGGLDPERQPGDVVIGGVTLQYDLENVTGPGGERFRIKDPATGQYYPDPLPAHPRLLDLANRAADGITFSATTTTDGERRPEVVTGIIATGSSFVACEARRQELRDRFNADGVEMEGAAVAQVCFQQQIPCIVIRGLSDHAGAQAHETLEHFEECAARNAQHVVLEMLRLIPIDPGDHDAAVREPEPAGRRPVD